MENKKMGIGVGVILIRDGKVLLGKRHEDPVKASSEMHGEGTWTLIGGKVDFGESFEEALVREAKEETNIDIDLEHVECVSVANNTVPSAHFVTVGFVCVGSMAKRLLWSRMRSPSGSGFRLANCLHRFSFRAHK